MEKEDFGVLKEKYQGRGIPFTNELEDLMTEKYISRNFNSFVKNGEKDMLSCACKF